MSEPEDSIAKLNRLQAEEDARIHIHDSVDEICRLLDIDSSYVAEMNIKPSTVEVILFRGKDGFCKGPKYVDEQTGRPAMQLVDFKVRA